MAKYLITGFSGFVSEYFLSFLNEKKENDIILGIDVRRPDFSISDYENLSCRYEQINMLNQNDLENLISQFKPYFVLHLASSSSVAYSWENPVESFKNNTNIFLNLLECIRLNNLSCRILSVGSSEEYGNFELTDLPLKEVLSVKPQNPYSVARVSQELLSQIYANGYGLDILMTRSFNHYGPGQKDIFVISSFAKQLVELSMQGKKYGELITGDTSIIRDFVDVRDVVEAYYLLFQKGKRGEIYNVCSGHGQTLTEIIKIMADKLNLKIDIRQDPKLIRPIDNKIVIGSNKKIAEHIGWGNKISIDKSISDILNYWQEKSTIRKEVCT
jgi:GDP-4-dehydro-6-deoxy-D-mannose reductase